MQHGHRNHQGVLYSITPPLLWLPWELFHEVACIAIKANLCNGYFVSSRWWYYHYYWTAPIMGLQLAGLSKTNLKLKFNSELHASTSKENNLLFWWWYQSRQISVANWKCKKLMIIISNCFKTDTAYWHGLLLKCSS